MSTPRDWGFHRSSLHTRIRTAGQYCNTVFIGDSTSNGSNQHTSTANPRSSWSGAALYEWRTTDRCGYFTHNTDQRHGLDIGDLSASNYSHGTTRRGSGVLTSDSYNNPSDGATFKGGLKQFGVANIRDRFVSSATAGSANVTTYGLIDTVPGNDDWFDNAACTLDVMLWAEENAVGDVDIYRQRRNAGGTATGTALLATVALARAAAAEEWVISAGHNIPTAAQPYPQFRLTTPNAAALNKSLLLGGGRFYKTGTLTGFETSWMQGDGYVPGSFLDPADTTGTAGQYRSCKDAHLSKHFEIRGWPNVVWIALGVNSSNLAVSDPAQARTTLEKIIERIAAVYVAAAKTIPYFVLMSPHHGPSPSCTLAQADAWAAIGFAIANEGTSGHSAPSGSALTYAAVPADPYLHSINTRLVMADYGANGDVWDAAGRFYGQDDGTDSATRGLADNVHPSYYGARGLMLDAIYNGVLANPTTRFGTALRGGRTLRLDRLRRN